MANIDNLVEEYQTVLNSITLVQDRFIEVHKFKEGEWMNDFVYLGQCFLNVGQAMREELYSQEAIISMYHNRFGPLDSDQLSLSIKNAQAEKRN
jgi:hypothetical protein